MATGSIDTGTDQLLCEVRERVAVITLNRPESRNALGDILTPALRRMIRERGEDPDVGALLITGAGTAVPAPVISNAPTSGSSPRSRIMRRKAGVRISPSALRDSGRLSVMTATRSLTSHRS